MIQGFRPAQWLACAALAAAALAPTAPAYAWPLSPAPRTAPATGPADDDPLEELAGSAAGAGRERPGRPVGEPADPELTVASRPLPVRPRTEPQPPPKPPPPAAATPPAPARALGTEPNERAADLAAHILPLGTGFALMGLGLGYLGVRLRRSA
ncbi:hypothetical protein ACIGFK_08640 [Streptomyces sp. NPDC085524]|uniref:hypothetical protein n=1 Tax=unclassified Streptomyces TaxID=2593676 RepID=UPI0035D92ADA